MKAIGAGKHALTEKPMALSVKECMAIIEAAKKNKVRVGIDFHKRWDPAAITVKNEIASGKFGQVMRGYMSMDDIIDVPVRWLSWAHLSSPAFFLGVHCYDLIRWYMQCEAVKVFAKGHKNMLKGRGIDTYDNIQALITFENGAVWVVENSWILPGSFPKSNDGRTFILGTNGYVRIDSQNRGVEIFTEEKATTPNSYFLNKINEKPFGFGVQPVDDFVENI